MCLLYKDAGNSPIEQVSLVGLKMIQAPTPPPTSTIHTLSCFILSEGFYFFQEHIYCMCSTYTYLGTYQQNSPQQLKICRTNLNSNTRGSINTGVPVTPCFWLSVSQWVLISLGLPESTQACCWQEETAAQMTGWGWKEHPTEEYRLQVAASNHRGVSAPRRQLP